MVVIIGLLAAIAIPKFAATKDKAKLASVRSDIRNIMTAQEAYFFDYATYTATLNPQTFVPTPGNTAAVVQSGGSYTVTAGNPSISSGFYSCTVEVGTGSVDENKIICS